MLVPNHPNTTSRASFSRCNRYRYSLIRTWNPNLPRLCICMLNPSTATATQNDPTVRRAIGYALDHNFGSIEVVNAFALRATDPNELYTHPHPAQPPRSTTNDHAIARAARRAHLTIAAWGAHAAKLNRAAHVRRLLPPDTRCLGLTNAGEPRHPLYLPKNAPLIPLSSPPE